MRINSIPFFVILILHLSVSTVNAKGVGISLSYGGWTVSPFTSLVEKESEEMIRNEFSRLMDPVLPPYILFDNQIDADFSGSSGKFLSCRFWANLSKNMSISIRGDLIHFRMPFQLFTEQEFTFENFVLAKQTSEGTGSLEIKSVMLSLLCGLKLFKWKNLDILLTGGVSVMPFEGNFNLDGQVSYTTFLGTLTFKEEENTSIKNLRTILSDIPHVIISPSVGVSLYYRLFNSGGLTLDATISQGLSFALGGYILL